MKHLMIVLARQESVVRVRSVVLIAMLAMGRKFIILDLNEAQPFQLLALGAVYWLVLEQDRRASIAGGPANALREPRMERSESP